MHDNFTSLDARVNNPKKLVHKEGHFLESQCNIVTLTIKNLL